MRTSGSVWYQPSLASLVGEADEVADPNAKNDGQSPAADAKRIKKMGGKKIQVLKIGNGKAAGKATGCQNIFCFFAHVSIFNFKINFDFKCNFNLKFQMQF